jgi:hypothetical protein
LPVPYGSCSQAERDKKNSIVLLGHCIRDHWCICFEAGNFKGLEEGYLLINSVESDNKSLRIFHEDKNPNFNLNKIASS